MECSIFSYQLFSGFLASNAKPLNIKYAIEPISQEVFFIQMC